MTDSLESTNSMGMADYYKLAEDRIGQYDRAAWAFRRILVAIISASFLITYYTRGNAWGWCLGVGIVAVVGAFLSEMVVRTLAKEAVDYCKDLDDRMALDRDDPIPEDLDPERKAELFALDRRFSRRMSPPAKEAWARYRKATCEALGRPGVIVVYVCALVILSVGTPTLAHTLADPAARAGDGAGWLSAAANWSLVAIGLGALVVSLIAAVVLVRSLREARKTGRLERYWQVINYLQREDIHKARRTLIREAKWSSNFSIENEEHEDAAGKVCSSFNAVGALVASSEIPFDLVKDWAYSVAQCCAITRSYVSVYRKAYGKADYLSALTSFEKLARAHLRKTDPGWLEDLDLTNGEDSAEGEGEDEAAQGSTAPGTDEATE